MNQVAVVHASKTPERVIVLPNEEFDVLTDRPGYRLCDDGDLRARGAAVLFMLWSGSKATQA